jgi:hypothetical protein
MAIIYEHNRDITDAEFVDLLQRSTLAERRPVTDPSAVRAIAVGSRGRSRRR